MQMGAQQLWPSRFGLNWIESALTWPAPLASALPPASGALAGLAGRWRPSGLRATIASANLSLASVCVWQARAAGRPQAAARCFSTGIDLFYARKVGQVAAD